MINQKLISTRKPLLEIDSQNGYKYQEQTNEAAWSTLLVDGSILEVGSIFAMEQKL